MFILLRYFNLVFYIASNDETMATTAGHMIHDMMK